MSGEDIWNDAIGELLDLILERQLALFHPGKLQLIAIARRSHSLNFFVEAPMFALEHDQHFPRVIVVHAFILQEPRSIVTSRPSTPSRMNDRPSRTFC